MDAAVDQVVSLVQQIQTKPDARPTLSILYHPDLKTAVGEIQQALGDSGGTDFFLLKHHLEHARFFLDYYKLPLDLTWDALVANLEDFVSDLSTQTPYEIQAVFDANDGMRLTARHISATAASLFDGLIPSQDRGVTDEPEYMVFIDNAVTVPTPETSFRTTYETLFAKTHQRFVEHNDIQEDQPVEVLLVNGIGEIMMGCQTSIAVRRDGRWTTPHIMSGGDCDAMRKFLLVHGVIVETYIKASDLELGEHILVFNPVIGVARGKIANTVGVKVKRQKRPTRPMTDNNDKPTATLESLAEARSLQTLAMKPPPSSVKHAIPGTSVISWDPQKPFNRNSLS